ncbi:hypothetical protein [Streptomyces sp. NPDC059828]
MRLRSPKVLRRADVLGGALGTTSRRQLPSACTYEPAGVVA